MAVDALSEVLRTVRLTGAAYFNAAASAPWVAEPPTRERVLARILPGARHLISYHVVIEGRCFASLIDAEPLLVEAGEVIVFIKGDPHVLSSSPGMRADPVAPERSPPPPAARCHSRCATVATDRLRPGWSAASWPAMPIRSIRFSTCCRQSSRRALRTVDESNWLDPFVRVAIRRIDEQSAPAVKACWPSSAN